MLPNCYYHLWDNVGMKICVKVGQVKIDMTGIDLTHRQVRDLMRLAGTIAAGIPATETAVDSPLMGFTSHMEKAAEIPIENFYTDDE